MGPVRIDVAAGLLASVLVLLTACDEPGDGMAAENDSTVVEQTSPIAAIELQPRDLSRILRTSAVVQPLNQVRLASRTGGTLEDVLVDIGDKVREGDLLALLDLSEEEAQLARARAEEAQAERDYERVARLRSSQSISAAEYERVRMSLQVARSERRLWESRVDFGRITSPMDAVVAERLVDPGEGVGALDTLFELVSMEALVLRLGVSELDVVHIQPGQTVPVQLDALPDLELDGTIRRIFPTADQSSRLVTVEIALPVDAAMQGVRPGFLGRVHIAIDLRPETLAVPAGAIGEDEAGRYVYVIADDRLERRNIETGLTRGQWTEVLAGLKPGEIILATNPIDMRAGQAVRIVGWRG